MNHYFNDTSQLKKEIRFYNFKYHNLDFNFKSNRGVFSKDHLDYGSYLLIEESLKYGLEGNVLDYGSGIGVIACIIKKMKPELNLYAVEINPNAYHLGLENFISNNTIVNSYLNDDILKLEEIFNYIILNPPIRMGKEKIFEMYTKAYEKLTPNGSLIIVIRKNHGAKSTYKKLFELYRKVEILNSRKGHVVMLATK